MRTISSPEDFERVIAEFLEWRVKLDEEIHVGRARRAGEAVETEMVDAA